MKSGCGNYGKSTSSSYVNVREEERVYQEKSWIERFGIGVKGAIKGFFGGIWTLMVYFFHIIWAIILLALFLPFVIILWIPWTFFPRSNPVLWISTTKRRRVKYGHGKTSRSEETRDAFAWIGQGIERHSPRAHRTSMFFKGRAWEIYEVLRDSWRSIHRQGLQYAGVISGSIILLYQIEMMAHDYSNGSVG